MIKKKIPAPLTETELKEKIAANKDKVIIRKGAESLSSIRRINVDEIKDFSLITIESVGYRQDTIGIDGNGKEHIFHGGPWVGFNWQVPGFGFGELTISLRGDKIVIDSERLGKDFVKAFLCDMVDKAEVK